MKECYFEEREGKNGSGGRMKEKSALELSGGKERKNERERGGGDTGSGRWERRKRKKK